MYQSYKAEDRENSANWETHGFYLLAVAATSMTSKSCLCFPAKRFPGIIVGLILWIMGASHFGSVAFASPGDKCDSVQLLLGWADVSALFSQLRLLRVWIPDSCQYPCNFPPAVPLHPQFPLRSTFTNNCFQTVTGAHEIPLNQSLHSALEAGTQQGAPKKAHSEKATGIFQYTIIWWAV